MILKDEAFFLILEDEIKNKKVSAEKAILNASASFEETLTKTLEAAKKSENSRFSLR